MAGIPLESNEEPCGDDHPRVSLKSSCFQTDKLLREEVVWC